MSIIVGLYGGPGTGKSTMAAKLFAHLKEQGANAELVREYVKDWAWENRPIGAYDQLYILGKQIRKESMLLDKVSHIVTDSPVGLAAYYADKYSPSHIRDGVVEAVKGFYAQLASDGHTVRHIFLVREKPYNPAGRYQTEEQAKAIDEESYLFLRGSIGLPLETRSTTDTRWFKDI